MAYGRAIGSLLLAFIATCADAVAPTVVDISSRGLSIRVTYFKLDAPIANFIWLLGGDGVVGYVGDGSRLANLANAYAGRNVAVAYVDYGFGISPSFRLTPEHLADMQEVMKFLRGQANVPAWLGGISNGSLSAGYAGINLPDAPPFGVVLASSVIVAAGSPSLLQMNLEALRRPTFILQHAQDECTPASAVPQLMQRLTGAPVVELVILNGGTAGPLPCGQYHLFEGLDEEVAEAVSGFIKKYNPLLAPNLGTVVEYYWSTRDHYFVSSSAAEIAALDGAPPGGWVRTGKTFKTRAVAQDGTSPVCRFYLPPPYGDSHFYGRGSAECEATHAAYPGFVYESPAVMYMYLPTLGVCAPGTVPVYRVFDNRQDANHRYTIDRGVRDQMVALGWIAEGDGPDNVVMCAPQ